jgi:hypothetical protein
MCWARTQTVLRAWVIATISRQNAGSPAVTSLIMCRISRRADENLRPSARYGNDPRIQYFETVALTDKASGKAGAVWSFENDSSLVRRRREIPGREDLISVCRPSSLLRSARLE